MENFKEIFEIKKFAHNERKKEKGESKRNNNGCK